MNGAIKEQREKNTWSKGRLFTFTGIVFAILATYKAIQHLTFNTYAYDLGIRASILYNMAFEGRVWDSLHSLHGFSGHFHPVSYLLAGLYRIWPNALLLCILQALAVSVGLLLFILLMDRLVEDRRLHLPLIVFFLINPFLHNVLCYDFHPEIFAIPLTLWFFFLMEGTPRSTSDLSDYPRKRKGPHEDTIERHGGIERSPKSHPVTFRGLIPALALLTLKEDMGILVFALGIYALARRRWLMGVIIAIAGFAWFFLALLVVIPGFQSPDQTALISLHYQGLGSNSGEIMKALFRRPWLVLIRGFGRPQTLLTIALLAASVGAFALTRWEILLVLPLLLAQLMSDNPHQIDLKWQYSAGILPVLFFAMIKGVRRLGQKCTPDTKKSWPPQKSVTTPVGVIILWGFVILALPAVALYFPNPFQEGIDPSRISRTYRLIERIPEDASVSVSNNLAPHLVNRKDVVLYPRINEADYVLVDLEGNIYPAKWDGRYGGFRELTEGYDTIYDSGGLLLLERSNPGKLLETE